jgi:hypothetical protein
MSKTNTTKPQPIKPNEAVQAAAKYFVQAIGQINEQTAVVVDGQEMSSDKKHWIVTLSHKDPLASALDTLHPGNDTRLQKVFTIDAFTSEVLSMKAK